MPEAWKAAASAAMDRYARGDDAAFEELYDLLAPRLEMFLSRRPSASATKCLGLTLSAAALPFVALTLLLRRSDPVTPVASGAALGTACSAAGGVLVELWCPVAATRHVVVGHILPIVVLAALGAFVSSQMIAMRAPRRR